MWRRHKVSTIKIKPAGQAAPRVEKFAQESIVYTLDMSEVLIQNELISTIDLITTNLVVEDKRVKMGKNLLIRVGPNDIGTSTYADYPVSVLVVTTDGNRKVAQFIVRVYK